MRWVLALLVLLLSVPVFGGHVEKVPRNFLTKVTLPYSLVWVQDGSGPGWYAHVAMFGAGETGWRLDEFWCYTTGAVAGGDILFAGGGKAVAYAASNVPAKGGAGSYELFKSMRDVAAVSGSWNSVAERSRLADDWFVFIDEANETDTKKWTHCAAVFIN